MGSTLRKMARDNPAAGDLRGLSITLFLTTDILFFQGGKDGDR